LKGQRNANAAAAWHMIIQRSKILPFPLIRHR
jgi:hypothetical protein